MFGAIDANHDGVISRQEFQQAFAAGAFGGQACPAQAAAGASCPNCGNVFAPDAAFCRKCGMKRQQAGAHPAGMASFAAGAPTTTMAGQMPVYAPGASAVVQPGVMQMQYSAPPMAGAMQYATAQTGPAQCGQANHFQQLDTTRQEFARVAQTLQAPAAAAPSQTVTYTMAQPQPVLSNNTMYPAAAQPMVFAGSSATVPGMNTSCVPPVAHTVAATQQMQYIAAPQYVAAPAMQPTTTYVTQKSPVVSHRQAAPTAHVMPRHEPEPKLEHRVVGERHITREELLETGNLVETEGSVVQSTEPQSSLLLQHSQQSRPAMAAHTYQADPFMASGAPVAETYASPSTVTYSMTAPVAHRGDFFDVFDTNHDGIIDRSEFQAAAATMNVGGYSGAPSMAVTSMSSQCPACGNTYAADAAFCRKCGQQRHQAGTGTLSGGPVAVI